MDFSFTEEQEAIGALARQIFEGHATVERVRQVEGSGDRFDRELWQRLADADLLGLVVPVACGGGGFGEIEMCLLLEAQGRVVAPVPLLSTLACAMTLGRFGADQHRELLAGVATGDVVLCAAVSEAGAGDLLRPRTVADEGPSGWTLTGTKVSVPWAHVASGLIVTSAAGVFLVDPTGPGVKLERAETTNRELHAHVQLDRAPARRVGGPEAVEYLVARLLVGLCALQVGVAEAALAMTATYTSQRKQFGKPLSAFQGVALKAADAYIDTEAMRVTMLQAAWRLSIGEDAWPEVLVAKWWAAEGGQRVVHVTQHLHGGIGADVEYPVHRYFLWGKQIEDTLGGASETLARLGTLIGEGRACR